MVPGGPGCAQPGRYLRNGLNKSGGRGSAYARGQLAPGEDTRCSPQRSFADVEYEGQKRQTRRAQFLQQMDGLIPWRRLEARLRPVVPLPASAGGHPIPWP